MLPTAQRTTRLLWWLMLLLCFMPLAGRGGDAQGNYVVLGFGSEACQTFLQARSNGLDLPYRHWLTGYFTAVNKLTPNTVDMRGKTDIDGMLWLLEQYCIKHPLHSFSRAMESLVTDLHPKRLTHMPHAP
jgi:hypothetical protein